MIQGIVVWRESTMLLLMINILVLILSQLHPIVFNQTILMQMLLFVLNAKQTTLSLMEYVVIVSINLKMEVSLRIIYQVAKSWQMTLNVRLVKVITFQQTKQENLKYAVNTKIYNQEHQNGSIQVILAQMTHSQQPLIIVFCSETMLMLI